MERVAYQDAVLEMIGRLTGSQVASCHLDLTPQNEERVEFFVLDRDLEAALQGEPSGEEGLS